MKALTLHQPWATLVAIGAKTIETRGRRTSYRGPLAIHASRTDSGPVLAAGVRPLNEAGWQENPACRQAAGPERLRPLPLGAVVATCTLADVVPMVSPGEEEAIRRLEAGDATDPLLGGDLWLCEPVAETDDPLEGIEAAGHVDVSDQRPYGDFAPGRYAWLLTDVRALSEPVPARGRQGLWTPDAELVAALGVAA